MQLLLIDGFNLVRRIYEARPKNEDEPLDNEVFESASSSLGRALRRHSPSHACCVFDSHESTWRHDLFPAYKANRKPTPAPLLDAIPGFEQAFEKLGVQSICIPHFEADDVIATMAIAVANKGKNVTILSTDKNFLQLLGDNIHIFNHFEEEEYDSAWVMKKYGVTHNQLVDYWSLTGDSTNNISGVPGIGPKTAQKLIDEHKSLDALLDIPPADNTGKKIELHRQDAEDARELISLNTNVNVGINLNQLRYIKTS